MGGQRSWELRKEGNQYGERHKTQIIFALTNIHQLGIPNLPTKLTIEFLFVSLNTQNAIM